MNAEHTDVDEYTCPEPGCEFVIGAVGPVDDDGYDPFAEEVREHQARHYEERVEALAPTGPSKRVVRRVLAALLALSSAGAGYALHDAIEPSARECVVAVNTADRLHIALNNLLSTVRVRGDAIGREAYAEADDDVNSVLDEVEPLNEAYTGAANACTGGAR